MISKDSHNAIFSQESAAGQLRLDLRDGQTISPCGQEVAPANHSAVQENSKAKKTNATCGPSGLTSSKSAALQSSMESKLRALLPTGGLTMFTMIWKQKTTPSGRQYCQLAVSGSRTKEIDCGLLATPSARDYKDTQGMTKVTESRQRMDQLPRQIPSNGSPAQTESSGQLNTEFVCWLMGYSTAHLSSMALAMQSFRSSRQNLSKAQKE